MKIPITKCQPQQTSWLFYAQPAGGEVFPTPPLCCGEGVLVESRIRTLMHPDEPDSEAKLDPEPEYGECLHLMDIVAMAHRQIVWLNFRNVLRCGHSQETGKLFPLMRN